MVRTVQQRELVMTKATKDSSPNKAAQRALYQMQADLCASLAHPVRLEILDMLFQGDCTGSDLTQALGIPKANVSQHISILRDAGIVVTRRNGVQIEVSLAVPEVREACGLVKKALAQKIAADNARTLEQQALITQMLNTGKKKQTKEHA
jgi:DNA-binding transcriptional ArsR family regulator